MISFLNALLNKHKEQFNLMIYDHMKLIVIFKYHYLATTINRDSVLFLFHDSICQLDQDGSQNNSKLIRVKSLLRILMYCI